MQNKQSERYYLAILGSRNFLLSLTSYTILEALHLHGELMHEELAGKVDAPLNSLYVFCQRLQAAGLVSKRHERIDGRRRSLLKSAAGLQLDNPLEVVR